MFCFILCDYLRSGSPPQPSFASLLVSPAHPAVLQLVALGALSSGPGRAAPSVGFPNERLGPVSCSMAKWVFPRGGWKLAERDDLVPVQEVERRDVVRLMCPTNPRA